ncbi:uncharacterized protein TNCV_1277231 [Trichonephila clavipes]|nr:uncharacterized protein TNCV_1277231 [Trichonephila clavipes]
MVLKANDRRTSCPCHDEFRGPRSDYVRQVALATTTTNRKQRMNLFTVILKLNMYTLQQSGVAAVAEWYRYRTVACFVTGSSPVPLKTRRVGQRCTLNLSRAETSSRWCGVVVRRGGVPAQVSSTSLDHGSKLRGPSPKALV